MKIVIFTKDSFYDGTRRAEGFEMAVPDDAMFEWFVNKADYKREPEPPMTSDARQGTKLASQSFIALMSSKGEPQVEEVSTLSGLAKRKARGKFEDPILGEK